MAKSNKQQFTLVPFVREKSHHITVVALLSGRPARLIVDTGAGGTIVDTGALAQFGLKLSSTSRKGVGVGSSSMRTSRIAKYRLVLGDLDVSDTRLLALDLSHVNAGLTKAKVAPVHGVLGADVLWRHRALIDYSRGLLFLERAS